MINMKALAQRAFFAGILIVCMSRSQLVPGELEDCLKSDANEKLQCFRLESGVLQVVKVRQARL